MDIFDRSLLRTHLQRAQSSSGHDFLWSHAAKELQDRLLDIKRDFTNAVEISARPYVLTDEFLKQKKIASLIHANPLCGENDLILDDEFFPFAPASLEIIVSVNHLHWINDVPGILAQWRHALKPDGVLLGVFFGGETLQELRHCLALAESEFYGGISPRISPFITLQDTAALMQRTQFALPVVDHNIITVTYPDLKKLIADLRGTGQTNAILKRNPKILTRKFWARVEEIYRDLFSNDENRLIATVELIYFLGWAPDTSQPQPLKRGSGTTSLIDILGK